MNTFLPHKSYFLSAMSLDNKRLGKQRVETLQILKTLAGLSSGWNRHPAVKMWAGYEYQLGLYGICICAEWRRRGYKDNCAEKIVEIAKKFPKNDKKPTWLTDEFCQRHRSNLLRKNPEFYGEKFPNVPNNLPYIWPERENNEGNND